MESSKRRFKTIADHAPVLLWIADTDMQCTFCNKGWLDFTGRTLEQELGTGWMAGVHPDDVDRCLQMNKASLETRSEFYIEYRLRRHDGEYRWISDKGVPSYTEDKLFEGFIGACMDIHDRIVFEEKLKESEARLRIAALSSELGTWDYDPITQVMTWDSACKDLFGSSQDTPVTLDLFWAKMHPDDQPAALESMLRALNPDIAENYESEYRIVGLPGNKLRWIRARGRAFFDQSGAPVRFAGTVLDITDKKIVLQTAQENERKFRLLADVIPQLIWTADASGKLTYYSQTFFEFSGLSAEEILDKGWLPLIHPDERNYNEQQWQKAVAIGESFIIEHRLRRHDGIYRWYLSRAVAQKDEQENRLMWVGSSTDIHEQKMMSHKLEHVVKERTQELADKHEQFNKQKEFAEIILNSSVDIISVFDEDLRYLKVNKRFEEIYERKEEELMGKKLTEAFPAMLDSPFENSLRETFKGTPIHTSGYQSLLTQRFYETFMIPLTSQDRVYAVLVIAHDNTELIQAYHQLEVKNNELENSNHNLQQFAYIASHDLQEPLRKIRTFSEMLHKQLPDLSESAELYFTKIDSSAKRMAGLIRDVLNYSRLANAEQLFTPVDLNAVMEEIRNDFELLIQEKKAVVNIMKLPQLSGIPLQLNQLFSNLMSNALKFSDEHPVIDISWKEGTVEELDGNDQLDPLQRYLKLTFKDNGIGFDAQYVDQIFHIFQRLNSKDKYEGTGIGLALCKKIMDNHHGVIAAFGELNKGARFDLYFPFKS